MDYWETVLRCLAHLVSILTNTPKALEAISKGWNAFKRFLEGLDGYEAGDAVPAVLCINVSDTISVGDGSDVVVQLAG